MFLPLIRFAIDNITNGNLKKSGGVSTSTAPPLGKAILYLLSMSLFYYKTVILKMFTFNKTTGSYNVEFGNVSVKKTKLKMKQLIPDEQDPIFLIRSTSNW